MKFESFITPTEAMKLAESISRRAKVTIDQAFDIVLRKHPELDMSPEEITEAKRKVKS